MSEINVITRLVEKYINIISEKFSTNVTNDKKRAVWKKITEEVNALGVANRTVKEVKTKWTNLHQEAKKSFTEFKREQQKTGGGPPPKPLTEATQRIVEIYKDCSSFTGLSGVESDSMDFNSISPCIVSKTFAVILIFNFQNYFWSEFRFFSYL